MWLCCLQSIGNEPDKLYKTLEIEVKGHDLAVIKSYEQFVCMAARELDVNVSKVYVRFVFSTECFYTQDEVGVAFQTQHLGFESSCLT